MSKIFISYRRDDSAGYAGRLYDRLAEHFGPDRIFMDIDVIEPGVDFVQAIQAALRDCTVVIVMMGNLWLDIADQSGQRRLDDPNDFVRLEVETALGRPDVTVVTALVRGARLPPAAELPPSMRGLLSRPHKLLTDERFHEDVQTLIAMAEEALQDPVEAVLRANRTRWIAVAPWVMLGLFLAPLAARLGNMDGLEAHSLILVTLLLGYSIAVWRRPTGCGAIVGTALPALVLLEIGTHIIWKPASTDPIGWEHAAEPTAAVLFAAMIALGPALILNAVRGWWLRREVS